jgi:lipid-A-disaccharide synthase-like uncharacterized protein
MKELWLAIGFLGQIIFGSRFVVQWICSEKKGKSYLPKVFWYLSICGSFLLLAYAIHKKDPVFIAGQVAGFAIYIRNIFLMEKPLVEQSTNEPKNNSMF